MITLADSFSKWLSEIFQSDFAAALSIVLGSGAGLTLIIIIIVSSVGGFKTARLKQIKSLKYERYFSKEGVFEGEYVILYEKVTNRSVFPLLFLDIESYVYGELALEGYTGLHKDDMQYFISRFHLMPNKTVLRRRKIKATKRGLYELGSVFVTSSGIPVYFDAPAKLYVYPKITKAIRLPSPKTSVSGDNASYRRIITDPFSLSGIRDMISGDPFNSINFKATAKEGGRRIKVNERDYCAGRVLMIYLNLQQPPDPIPTARFEEIMEGALSFIASAANRAVKEGYKVGFAANCRGEEKIPVFFAPAARAGAVTALLKETACCRLTCDMSFSALLERTVYTLYDSDVFIITPFMYPKYEEYIKILKKRNNNVVLMNTGR